MHTQLCEEAILQPSSTPTPGEREKESVEERKRGREGERAEERKRERVRQSGREEKREGGRE